MSCNGCRVLRKGCRDDCLLRPCLEWIDSPQAQAHATLFVAKFFGRATLMSFLSSVPTSQTSALFRSLLYEAVGRTVNPVSGAVGLLWTGNWHLCQLGVDKVLRGGALTPLSHPHFSRSHLHSSSTHRSSIQPQPGSPEVDTTGTYHYHQDQEQRAATPSEASTTGDHDLHASQTKLLTLFF